MKKLLNILLVLGLLVFAGCQNSNMQVQDSVETIKEDTAAETSDSKQLQVVTSIAPLAAIFNEVSTDNLQADSIVPAGASPHGYEITPKDKITLEKADLIITVGDQHIDGAISDYYGLDKTIDSSSGVEKIESMEHEHDEEFEHELDDDHEHETDEHAHEIDELETDEEHGHEHEHDEHELDPHIWLGLDNIKVISESYTIALSELYPDVEDVFKKNRKEFIEKIEAEQTRFLTATADKELQDFIVFHPAYGYMFADLGVDTEKMHVFRENVLSDPSASQIAELKSDIIEHGIKVAFVEPQFRDSQLQKFAKEFNIEILVLDPLGKGTQKNDFLQNYQNNLVSLQSIYE